MSKQPYNVPVSFDGIPGEVVELNVPDYDITIKRPAARLTVERNSRGHTYSVEVTQQPDESDDDVRARLDQHKQWLDQRYGEGGNGS